jgi:hypothetical protein
MIDSAARDAPGGDATADPSGDVTVDPSGEPAGDSVEPAGDPVERARAAAGRDGLDMPGSAVAREHGCVCSVLANAGFRRGREPAPMVDPACRVHAL